MCVSQHRCSSGVHLRKYSSGALSNRSGPHLPVVWPWTCHWPSLCLNFFLSNFRMIIVSMSQDWGLTDILRLEEHLPSWSEVKWSEVKSLSRVRLFATPWTVAYQAPRSMGFSRQAYWSGLPFPSAGDLPNPGIEPGSLALQTDALPSEPLTVTQWYWCGITLWAERS